jgi:hypothetical protein
MRLHPAILLLATACTATPRPGADTACGIATVAGPAFLLSEFGTPGAVLIEAPESLPARLVARFVAGPASTALVGRNADTLEVGVEGGLPQGSTPGFGILVVARDGGPAGVLIYNGSPVLGAPPIGNVTAGAARVPLLGIRVDLARIQDPRCPFFPDSLLR